MVYIALLIYIKETFKKGKKGLLCMFSKNTGEHTSSVVHKYSNFLVCYLQG